MNDACIQQAGESEQVYEKQIQNDNNDDNKNVTLEIQNTANAANDTKPENNEPENVAEPDNNEPAKLPTTQKVTTSNGQQDKIGSPKAIIMDRGNDDMDKGDILQGPRLEDTELCMAKR